jgi:hypothetical protein
MEVVFTKTTPDGAYFATFTRADKVTCHLLGYDRKWSVPHDLAHLIAERAFGLRHGFWGSAAAGGRFKSMTVISGRQRHDAAARSAALLKANASELTLAECVAAVVHHAVEDPLPQREAYSRLIRDWGTLRLGECPYQRDTLAAAVTELTTTRAQWQELDVGGTLAATW